MQLAKVIGDIVATRKDDNLHGIKLMVLQPLAPDGSAIGRTLVAVPGSGRQSFSCAAKKRPSPFIRPRSPRMRVSSASSIR